MPDVKDAARRTRANRLLLIRTELDLALTLASAAANARRDAERKARNEQQARLAYETATHLLAGADLSPAERTELGPKLQRVKTSLEAINSRAELAGTTLVTR